MKIVKQLANKVKSAVENISTFKPTQLSFWYGGQYVNNQTMNVFSQDLYEKLALLTTNVNNFPAVIFSDGGISKFTIGPDYQTINLPSLSCVFQLQTTQGNNLLYKPYVIGYSDPHTLAINLNGITYIYAEIEISNIESNPTNVVTILSYSNSNTPLTDPKYCLLCIIRLIGSGYSKTIDFSQTNFLVNSAVTTTGNTGNTELINPQNKINAITPQALSLFSNLGHVDAFDERVRANGGYAKDRVIREYDTTGYWVYYQSLIDNNINIKPTLASHVGWRVIYDYNDTDFKFPTKLWANNFKDINMPSSMYELFHIQGIYADDINSPTYAHINLGLEYFSLTNKKVQIYADLLLDNSGLLPSPEFNMVIQLDYPGIKSIDNFIFTPYNNNYADRLYYNYSFNVIDPTVSNRTIVYLNINLNNMSTTNNLNIGTVNIIASLT